MPYLESNNDVSENSTFGKALAVLGTVTFAAAAGQMAFKSIAEKWGQGFGKGQLAKLGEKATERDVIKSLYGNKNELNAKDYERLWRRTGDNPVPIRSKNGAQYAMETTSSGAPKFVRTGGTSWENFRENHGPSWLRSSNGKDLQNLNREMKNLWKGAGNPNSKLDIYTNLVGNKGNLNLGADDFTKATEHLYSGEGQAAGRRAMGWNDDNYEKEINWMNDMWGGDSLSPNEKVVADAKAAAAKKTDEAETARLNKLSEDNRLTPQQLKELGVIPDHDEPRADGQMSFFDKPGAEPQGPPRPPQQPEQMSFLDNIDNQTASNPTQTVNPQPEPENIAADEQAKQIHQQESTQSKIDDMIAQAQQEEPASQPPKAPELTPEQEDRIKRINMMKKMGLSMYDRKPGAKPYDMENKLMNFMDNYDPSAPKTATMNSNFQDLQDFVQNTNSSKWHPDFQQSYNNHVERMNDYLMGSSGKKSMVPITSTESSLPSPAPRVREPHPFDKYKNVSGHNFPPSEALTPEARAVRESRAANKGTTFTSDSSRSIFLNARAQKNNIDNEGFWLNQKLLRDEGWGPHRMDKPRIDSLRQKVADRKQRLGLS